MKRLNLVILAVFAFWLAVPWVGYVLFPSWQERGQFGDIRYRRAPKGRKVFAYFSEERLVPNIALSGYPLSSSVTSAG
jgi:hypothetical protein